MDTKEQIAKIKQALVTAAGLAADQDLENTRLGFMELLGLPLLNPAQSTDKAPKWTKEKLEWASRTIGGWFRRRPSTGFSVMEINLLKANVPPDMEMEDWGLMEQYYTSGFPYLRKDISTLLRNFRSELDRARAWQDEQQPETRPTMRL